MTVKDLIELLQQQDPGAELVLNLGDDQQDLFEPAQVGLSALELDLDYQRLQADDPEPVAACCLYLSSALH